MLNLKVLWYVVLFTLNWHEMQTHALLKITLNALDITNKLITEIEKTSGYQNEEKMNNKLENVTNIAFEFVEQVKEFSLESRFMSRFVVFHRLGRIVSDYTESFGTLLARYNIVEVKDQLKDHSHPIMRSALSLLYNRYLNSHTDANNPLNDQLRFPYEVIRFVDEKTNQSIISYSTNTTMIKDCIDAASHQEGVVELFKDVMYKEALAYISIQTYLACYKVLYDGIPYITAGEKEKVETILQRWTESNKVVERMKFLKRQYEERNIKTYKKLTMSLSNLPRDKYSCDPEKPIEDGQFVDKFSMFWKPGTYTILHDIFQKYIINEVDLNKDGSCADDCPTYKKTKVFGCFDKEICNVQRQCDGTLWECEQTFTSKMRICPSKTFENSRYAIIDVEGRKYGQEDWINCKTKNITAKSWIRIPYQCSYCMCTCENSNKTSDRYFSLRPVTSNVHSNYVITDLKFVKINHVIYIQIQEARLLRNGDIDTTSKKWQPVNNFSVFDENVKEKIDYHTITWNERTVFLDKLDSTKNHVLTGLRFNLIDGNLRLGIYVTPFDFETGKLLADKSYWYFNDAQLKHRVEFKFDDDYMFNPKSDQYFKFTTSTLDIDVGQNVVPYIDIQSIKNVSPALDKYSTVPNSGVAIFVKKYKNIAPSLSLKLITYDFAPHFKVQNEYPCNLNESILDPLTMSKFCDFPRKNFDEDFIKINCIQLDDDHMFNPKSDQYFKFTTSTLDIDIGQNTVSYIDVQQINRNIALFSDLPSTVPNSGVTICLLNNTKILHHYCR